MASPTSTWGLTGDAAEFVESFYRLDLDQGAWLDGMWRAMQPLVPGSGPLVAGRYTLSASGKDYKQLHLTGSHTSVTEQLDAATPGVDGAEFAATFGARKRVFTFLDVLGSRSRSRSSGMLRVMGELGGADALNINCIVVRDGNMLGASISASTLAAPVDLSAQARRAWDRFAGHLCAALRLREQADPIVEGVLAADGRVLDARGDARAAPMRDALKRAARAIERARLRDRRTDVQAVLDAWRAIYERRWTLVETTESDGRRLLLARVNPPEQQPVAGGSAREQQVAALLVQGVSQKAIGFELQIAPSTVAYHVKKLMQRVGAASVPDLVARLAARQAT